MENKQKSENVKQPDKLTYEELSRRFADLYTQYQKATDYIQKLQSALAEQTFNQTSFFLSMLFKVVEHPEMYDEEFVKWSVENIEVALKSFSEEVSEDGNEKEAKQKAAK